VENMGSHPFTPKGRVQMNRFSCNSFLFSKFCEVFRYRISRKSARFGRC